MENIKHENVGSWLLERISEERLSLRDVSAKSGLAHSTIHNIIRGKSVSTKSLARLADAFGKDGQVEHRALYDYLLVLAGHRQAQPVDMFNIRLARLIGII